MFMNEQGLWMKIWIKNLNLFFNVGNRCYIYEKLNKRNMVETIYVGFF